MTQLNTNLLPRLQSHLIGHKDQWLLLKRQFQEKKGHPAWLLSGQKGIGKATFAYQAARYILHKGQDQVLNKLIDQNSHPNLLIIERRRDENGKLENEITVDTIRKLKDFAHQSPTFPGWRVIVIDAVDDLNRNAANALLKILEEPPPEVLIFLICHSIGRILPTVRSRCCLIPFQALTYQDLAQILNEPLQSLALELSRGSLGRLSHLQKFDLDLLLNEVVQNLGALFHNKLYSLQNFIEGFEKGDERIFIVLDLLTWLAYCFSLIQSGIGSRYPSQTEITEIAAFRPVSHWLLVYEKLTYLVLTAERSHLDLTSVLLAAFLCFESPWLVENLGCRLV